MVSLYNVFFGSIPVSFEDLQGLIEYVQTVLGVVVDSQLHMDLARMMDGDSLTIMGGSEAYTITLE